MRRARFYAIEITLVGILGLAVAYFGYLAYGLLLPDQRTEPFSGERAMEYAAQQLAFGERSTGSDGNVQMTEWLTGTLQQMGWDVIVQPFRVTDTVTANNVVAVRGLGAATEPVVILATHFDSRLFADKDRDEADWIQPAPGANAGASGTAVLMELADSLDVTTTGHTVCLVFLDAEDNGGLAGWDYAMGSAQFIQGLVRGVEPIDRCMEPRAVVYLDMVGANQAVTVDSPNTPALAAALQATADAQGVGEEFEATARSNEVTAVTRFAEQDMPVAEIVAWDYPERHTTDDELDQLSALGFFRVGQTLKAWLEQDAPF